MLLLLVISILLQEGESATCRMALNAIEAVTNLHNELRANVAKRNLSKAIFGDIPGSKTLFKLKYDCTNEGFALSTIGNTCKHSSIYMYIIGRGENFITYRLGKKPDINLVELFGYAVEDWANTVKSPLSSDVVYSDSSMEPFANMIYNKTLKFGCSYKFCNTTSKVVLACVYDNRPKEGEPLYSADSMNSIGCRKPGPCKKIIKGTDVNCDSKVGLCDQDPPTTTPSTEEERAGSESEEKRQVRVDLSDEPVID